MKNLNIEYEKYKLKNGLEIILHENNNLPITAVNIWYKVGSANEHKGKTGIAHLFEHMMFQGSQNVPKEAHFRFIQEAGGSLNGSTSFDRTNYYEKIPANFLELIFWLESDRMGYLLPALTPEKLKNQKEVVSNERLERYDNQPYGLAWEILISNLYPDNHPYSWSTIGSLEDISSFNLDDVSSFFKKYYSPSNATLVVAGSFDKNNVKDLISKYFEVIPSTNGFEKLNAILTNLSENKFITHQDNVQLERLYLAWHSEKAYEKDDAALDILSDILTGSKNSRLYKTLVFEKELAQDITAYQYSGKYAGHFMFIATAKPGVSLSAIKNEIFNEIDKIRLNSISTKELIKSKNGIKSGFIYSLQNIDSLADQLNSYNYYLNEPNSFNKDLKRYESISDEEIKTVIEKYFYKPYVELQIIPKSKDIPNIRERKYLMPIDRAVKPNPTDEILFSLPEINEFELENGLKVLFVKKDNLPIIQANLISDCGSKYDSKDKKGLANLFSMVLDEGAGDLTALELSDEFDLLGTSFNISCSRDTINFTLQTLTEHFEKALQLFSTVILTPHLNKKDFEREKRKVETKILQIQDEPDEIASSIFDMLVLGKDNPYAYQSLGYDKTISNISIEDLKTFYSNYFIPNNSALIVVGNISLTELKNKLNKNLSSWKKKNLLPLKLKAIQSKNLTFTFLIKKILYKAK